MKRIAFLVSAAITAFLSAVLANGEPNAGAPKQEVIATFSIAAVDPATGQCGAAVASKYPAVGKVVAHARADVGAFCTQHFGVQAWGTKALDALAEKKLPEEVLADLLKPDKAPGMRQLGIIDMQGRSAQHHPVDRKSVV